MNNLVNPNTGLPFRIQYSSPKVIEKHLNQLNENKTWHQLTMKQREFFLKRFKKLLNSNKQKIAKAISMDIGKPLWESLTEVSASINKLDSTIIACNYRLSYPNQVFPDKAIKTIIQPIGTITVIGPFNFPLHIPNGQIIPALLTGNKVIVKPSEYAPNSSILIESLWKKTFHDIESPIVFCYGDKTIGEYLVNHSLVNAVFFTGSSSSGKKINEVCSKQNKLCVLEMGGNNPIIVEDSSRHLISNIIGSAFITSGQRCSCARRLIINKKHSNIIEKLIEETKKLPIGKFPSKEHEFMGPVVIPNVKTQLLNTSFEKSETLLKSNNLGAGGLVSPRIELSETIFDKELFGPILFIQLTDSFEESIEYANKTSFGLTASVFTTSAKKFKKAYQEIKAGIINWNCPTTGASGLAPFGGQKESGNFRPAGFNMIDHCIIQVGSTQYRIPSAFNRHKKSKGN